MMMMKRTSIVLMMLLSAMALTSVSAQQPARQRQGAGSGLSPETRQKVMASLQKAATFLGQKQKADGPLIVSGSSRVGGRADWRESCQRASDSSILSGRRETTL